MGFSIAEVQTILKAPDTWKLKTKGSDLTFLNLGGLG